MEKETNEDFSSDEEDFNLDDIDPMQELAERIKVDTDLNKDENALPFGYYNPTTEGKLIWMCGEDAEKRITSVFVFDFGDHKEKKCSYLKDLKEALFFRDELVKEGWLKLKPPKVTFKSKDGKELTRKQKRMIERKLRRQNNKENPFLQ